MGARMILGKVIAAPIAAASMALQDMQTEQTLRLQRQLLAAEGDVAEGSFPQRKRERGHGLLRSKRRPATMAKADKAKEFSSSHTISRPLPAAEVVTVSEEELAGVDWCQVQRHGEHPKRSAAERQVEEPAVQPRQAEVRPDRYKRPMTHKEVCSQTAKPLVTARDSRSLDQRARQVPSGNAAPTGAPAYAPPPPSERPLCVDEILEVPRSSRAVRMSAPPTAAPVLDALDHVKVLEEGWCRLEQRSVSRPPPPDVPPPPCPGLEPKIAMVSPPPPRLWPPSNYDMGCFSGGTGGTPGLSDDLEAPRRETQCDTAWLEDDVAKRLEAMVEDLAGPGFDFLDAFSKVDAARAVAGFPVVAHVHLPTGYTKLYHHRRAVRAQASWFLCPAHDERRAAGRSTGPLPMPDLCRWLDSALRRERDEMAMRHDELMHELHTLLDQAEMKMQGPKLDSAPIPQPAPEMQAQELEQPGEWKRLTSQSSARSSRREEDSKKGDRDSQFHVVRIQGQTQVKRESPKEEQKRAHDPCQGGTSPSWGCKLGNSWDGSRFEKMERRSASFEQRSAASKMFRIVTHPLFESVICSIIMINTLIMAFETQYYGLQLGYDLGIRTYDLPARNAWPGAEYAWEISEWIFGPIFLVELLIKLMGMKLAFFLDVWNIFDAVIAWLIDTVLRGFWPIDPMLLRLAKLGRLLRLMRLVRKLKGFDALYILTTALRGSVTVLLWSFLMLFLLQLIFALFLQRIVQETIVGGDRAPAVQEQLFLYFGTCSRSLLTMFEITLGNWPPVARILQDHVHEAFCAFSILHKITVGYALIAVINGVFLKETFSAAENDDKIMMRNTEKKRDQHIKKMKSLFEAADETGDGVLDREEFIQVMTDPEIVNWLAAMDLQIADPNALFDMVIGEHDEEGTIDAEQLVRGVGRLKGCKDSFPGFLVQTCLLCGRRCIQQTAAKLDRNDQGPGAECNFLQSFWHTIHGRDRRTSPANCSKAIATGPTCSSGDLNQRLATAGIRKTSAKRRATSRDGLRSWQSPACDCTIRLLPSSLGRCGQAFGPNRGEGVCG
eukprot:s294_g27.t1